MNICGIIAEYNPFHKGHLYHIEQTKLQTNADYIIAVMSGHFLQRGEPAIMDKWTRAKVAVELGVDLVIELPTYYASSSAQDFALGAVKLLMDIGVDFISFGAENANIDVLQTVADIISSEDEIYCKTLNQCLQQGLPYHQAVQQSIQNKLNISFEFKANNILAISYLSAIKKLHANIKPFAIQRLGDDYLDEHILSDIASATAIRAQLFTKPINWQKIGSLLPVKSFDILYQYSTYTQLDHFKMQYNSLASVLGAKRLAEIRGVSEGINNKLYAELSNILSLGDYVQAVTSKRYPKTRVQRIIISTLLGVKTSDDYSLDDLDYIRILAYKAESTAVIKHIKTYSQNHIFTNLARDLKKYRKANPLIDLDVAATAVYSTINPSVHLQSDYTTKPVRVE